MKLLAIASGRSESVCSTQCWSVVSSQRVSLLRHNTLTSCKVQHCFRNRDCSRNANRLGGSEFQALLDWHNTPTTGIGTRPAQPSPAQRLFGRTCKTLIPIAGTLLKPSYPTEDDTRKILGKRQRQKFYYDKHSVPLEPITVGDTVWMMLPGQERWTPS